MANKIKAIKLEVIRNPKGDILKYLNKKNKHLKKFGEIYFTEIKKNKTKGWNLHKKNTCLLTVPYGKVKFTFAKDIKKRKQSIIIDKKNYKIIVVPPKFWFKFISMTDISIVANTLEEIHNDNETLKIPIGRIR